MNFMFHLGKLLEYAKHKWQLLTFVMFQVMSKSKHITPIGFLKIIHKVFPICCTKFVRTTNLQLSNNKYCPCFFWFGILSRNKLHPTKNVHFLKGPLITPILLLTSPDRTVHCAFLSSSAMKQPPMFMLVQSERTYTHTHIFDVCVQDRPTWIYRFKLHPSEFY